MLRDYAFPKLTAREICQYPAGSELMQKLSAFHQVDPENLCLCNGAEQALKVAIGAVSNMKDATLLMPSPTWEHYWKLATAFGVRTVPYHYEETKNGLFELNMHCLEDKIDKAKRVVLLIASPSNPLGCRTDDKTIHKMVEMAAEKGYSIIDQTYAGFSGGEEETLASCLNTLPKALITRSLSKYYGMAGLRVGFVAATPETQKAFSIFGDYLGFNSFADKFAAECLDRHIEFEEIANKTVQGRERLSSYYSSLLGFMPFKSATNFLLVRVPEGYAEHLSRNGIKVRTFSDETIGDCVRITIPPKTIIERIENLTDIFCSSVEIKPQTPRNASRRINVIGYSS
ncbi:MAG: aminotransferase class I/II-fold pyridoxal phosphate-dependent enzyme [Alphaproteobacteria bacterium]|nr:aminotransferase class I/II-fold pyridoxal phosphate-dependent enzyme [Alphaproteobacteria bacterium]